MKVFMFSVFDSCAAVYDRPFVARSEGEATRGFSDICCNAEHPIGMHPEHYSLFRVGTFDDNKGIVEPEAPVFVASGQELVALSRKVDPEQIDAFMGANGLGEESHAS